VPVKVRVRRDDSEGRSQSHWWAPCALTLLFAASCGGPNNPEPETTESEASDPEITSISPVSGPAEGGTLVTITGVGFDESGSTGVLFGSASATGVAVVSDATIRCNSPAGTAGESVLISVVMDTGTLSSSSTFTYEAPPNAELEITWRNSAGAISTGVLTVELHSETPTTSENFRELAEQGLYDDTLFHRLRFQHKIEGGDFENGDGSGGHAAEFHGIGDESDPSTWRIPDEAGSSPAHQEGSLAMHLPAGADSAGSVFYIVCPGSDLSNRDGVNTVFGRSLSGTVDGLEVGFEALLDEMHRVSTGSGDVPIHPVRLVEVRLSGGSIDPPDPGGGGAGGDAPSIALLDPPFGPPSGNHQAVVVGSGFAADPDTPPIVTFGGILSEEPVVLNDETMFCNVPAGTPGTYVDLEVTTHLGTAVLEDGFQYLVGPVVAFRISWTGDDGVEHEGQIATELFEDDAPIHVDNFLQLTEGAYYDLVPFHRIIDGFMIQGGDFQNGDGTGGHAAQYYGYGDPDDPDTWTVPDEADNGLTHSPGILSMAKTGLPNSGGSQFFFVDRDSFPSHLDGVHTVFGRAAVGFMDSVNVTGLDVVDELSQVLTDSGNHPLLPVMIDTAFRIGGSSSPLEVGGDDPPIGELDRRSPSYQPWLVGGVLKARSPVDDAMQPKRSGTRGVFLVEGSEGDRLRVLVRALELGVDPVSPVVIAERLGQLSLAVVEEEGQVSERLYEVELKRDDRVLVFVPPAPACWVKAWIEPGSVGEE
jgi:cyclophilin family peptidyl-prolyl cis-trans isomerase